MTTIRVLGLADIPKAAATLYDAFAQDNLSQYLVSHIANAAERTQCLVELFKAYLHQYICHGYVLGTNEQEHCFETVALWSTPQSHRIYGFAAMTEAGFGGAVWALLGKEGREKFFDEMIPTFGNAARRILASNTTVYTLAMVGSTLQARGKGNLRRMFEHMFKLVICHEGATCYLECTAQCNIPVYNKFGFRAVEEITLGKSVTVTVMVRN